LKKGIFFFTFLLLFAAGFWSGRTYYKNVRLKTKKECQPIGKKEVFPITCQKPFVIVIPSYNNQKWVEKNLGSVLSQEYENYRVVYINDCSSDQTLKMVEQFLQKKDPQKKLELISNFTRKGSLWNLYTAVHQAKDEEIVVTLDGDDWLAHEKVLQRLNQSYQNPDVWLTYGQYMDYPSYQKGLCKPFDPKRLKKEGYRNYPWITSHLRTFYAGLFKKIRFEDFWYRGSFYQMGGDVAFMIPMLEMSGGKFEYIPDILYLYNRLNAISDGNMNFVLQNFSNQDIRKKTPYSPIDSYISSERKEVDLMVFSYNRPMQLYAFLESSEKQIKNLHQTYVLYRTSSLAYEKGYQVVQKRFPYVKFISQKSEKDFKPLLLDTLFSTSKAPFVFFAVDDLIVKEGFDAKECSDLLKKTKVEGVFTKLGTHVTDCYMLGIQQGIPQKVELAPNTYIWEFEEGKADFSYPHTLDMTLYEKDYLKEVFPKLEFCNPNTLEMAWSVTLPKSHFGIFFATSKVVNIPLNQVFLSQNRAMNAISVEELLDKFEQGYKIDYKPLLGWKNSSCHMEKKLEFVPR